LDTEHERVGADDDEGPEEAVANGRACVLEPLEDHRLSEEKTILEEGSSNNCCRAFHKDFHQEDRGTRVRAQERDHVEVVDEMSGDDVAVALS
jgi:hypothetical protein